MENANSCTDCGLVFDSSKSLDVHLSYHKENLMSKWGSSGAGGSAEDNNNVKKVRPAAADSSDFLFEFQHHQQHPQHDQHHHHQQQQQQQPPQQHQQHQQGAFHRVARPQYRYHPYGFSDRQIVTSSNQHQQPVQCEKCGLSMDASILPEHVAQMHPNSVWDEPQAEILDLDSHKVHVYQPPDEAPPPPPHHPWHTPQSAQPPQQQRQQQQPQQPTVVYIKEEPQQMVFIKEENGNSSPSNDLGAVSSSEVYLGEPAGAAIHGLPKAAWKSNEARRPKTYNCTACNKWFTSSGHLKRHYNTTLHKNAVKQSGGVDPATLPVSSHHHPPAPSPHEEFMQQQQQQQQQQQVHQPPPQHHVIHPPPPPPQHHQDFYYASYHHPNGNPPHGVNLPSFSQLTGVSYEPVGGVYQEKEVQLVSSTADDSASPPPAVHKCVDCDKTFNKACYLTQHNKSFHAGDKPYKCSRCGKRFTQEYLHLEHLSKHAGDKPYKCEICPKQFNHKTDLRRHMCLHSGDKPYACSFCGKGFIRKDHMLKHADTHKKKQLYKNEYRI